MNGIGINGITLFLGHLPNRKGLCFYFEADGDVWPMAYVRQADESKARDLWLTMLDGIPNARIARINQLAEAQSQHNDGWAAKRAQEQL